MLVRVGHLDVAGRPAPARGLGLLPGSLSVHCDGEPTRLPVYRHAVRAGTVPSGWAVDDGVGLLFRGGELVEVVSSRAAGASAAGGAGRGGAGHARRLTSASTSATPPTSPSTAQRLKGSGTFTKGA